MKSLPLMACGPGHDFGLAFEKAGPGAKVRVAVRRNGEILQFQWQLEARVITFYELVDLPSITAEQRRARGEWLAEEHSAQ